MNIETSTITRANNEYLVENIEDMIIRVNANQVEEILEGAGNVEENEVVILLATIKKNRIASTLASNKCYRKVDDEVATKAIIELLSCYNIVTLISVFEETKYYQIKEVLESDAPIRELDEFI